MSETKVCSRCGLEKPVADFYTSRRHKGYVQPCKDCHKKICSERYHKNRERILAQRRADRLRAAQGLPSLKREPITERLYKVCSTCGILKALDEFPVNEGYHQARCRACKNAMQRRRYEEDPSYAKEYALAWYHEHPDECWTIRRRRDARMRATCEVENSLTAAEWKEVLAKDGYRCHYCRIPYTKDNPATQEHVIPLSRGGSHTRDNVVSACLSCNSRKGTKTPEEWEETRAAFERIKSLDDE